ncbi:MAG: lipopolysaccharide export system protein LptA [Woeseiaceae bacterium]|jgi:lipopolysaccharide export system protein LptA
MQPLKICQQIVVLIAAMLCCTIGWTQTDELKLPISLDADSTDYDGKSSMLMFTGLRLTQGNIGIQANEGRASKLDFEDSVWHFSGNVIIDVENGHIECEVADLSFSGHELHIAIITGSPATFEMQRPDSEETTYAEAGRLEYDFSSGVVTFSEQATITEGGNQISSAYLVYNITEQRINAQSGGDGDPKVRITYTPGATDDLIPDFDAENEEPPHEENPDDTGDDGQ